MKKQIGVEHLRLGMYVAELDRPWTESRFLFQGFEIRTLAELAELKQLCQYVYVQTDPEEREANAKRTTVPISPQLNVQPVPTEERAGYALLDEILSKNARPPLYPDWTTAEEELPQARELTHKTRELIYGFWEDARLGHSLDIDGAKEAVSGIVQSILRNPDALVWLNEIKNQDSYTALHSLRVCVLALAFGRHLELPENTLQVLGLGALMHDIGKTQIPIEILNKPERLTPAEFQVVKSHVPRGVAILERCPGVPPAAIEVAKWHHERADGSGYAHGLRGEEISLFGQIGAIVDTYDAITSDRPYHRGMSAHDALRRMYSWRRKGFHDRLIEQFIQCMGVYPIGSIVEMSTGAIGVVISVNRLRRLRPRVALVLNADKQKIASARTIDLMEEEHAGPKKVEIRCVLPAGSFGINPLEFLPIRLLDHAE